MTKRFGIWLVVLVILSGANLYATILAAESGESMHTGMHAAAQLLIVYVGYVLRRRSIRRETTY